MRYTRTPLVIIIGVATLLAAVTASATEISGTISRTLTLTEDSRLVGHVTCTVTGAPCIVFGANGIALRLNGFNLTGLADPVTGCAGGQTADEDGILVQGIRGAVIEGPGIVQRFRAMGINVRRGSSRVLVTRITAATNCQSGIFVSASNDNEIEANVAVRNGNASFPCGGI
jgi:hypothetical protein